MGLNSGTRKKKIPGQNLGYVSSMGGWNKRSLRKSPQKSKRKSRRG